MTILFFLIPLSIVIAAAFLGAFIWAVRSGQYEDTTTPSMRLLTEETASVPPGTSTRRGASVAGLSSDSGPAASERGGGN